MSLTSAEPLWCGVDVGATATKLVLTTRDGELQGQAVRPSGIDYAATAEACLVEALGERPRDAIQRTMATGYGRDNVPFADGTATEIHCHAAGCYHLVPRALTIIDIGGQDNKVIRVDAQGRRLDFRMNRKCAAGTGAFLEEIALRLDLPVSDLDGLARQTTEAVTLSSFCTVFAKTEILAHLRRGVALPEIVRGAFLSVASRVVEMARLGGDVAITGGVVAHNPTIAEILSEKLGHEVIVPPHAQLIGALGAALLASQKEEQDA